MLKLTKREPPHMADIDPVAREFDQWAADGRDKKLADGHSHSVRTFLDAMTWSEPFSFLDVGCGNGWAVRHMASYDTCIRAVGIDKSAGMIGRAKKMAGRGLEEYHAASLEGWESAPFDVAFSMESLYYSPSVPDALSKAYSLIVPGGIFVCGTDYYAENAETARWGDEMGIALHMYSEAEWADMFRDAGFRTSTRHVTNPAGDAGWKRELGTLFVTGIRPKR